mmetsp:Transcript_34214/g.89393  ORF Transcript_34214/g.89393 Transcript_34214/m.89393 type:complete len:217 (-) Transcript_34214:34-684(-)
MRSTSSRGKPLTYVNAAPLPSPSGGLSAADMHVARSSVLSHADAVHSASTGFWSGGSSRTSSSFFFFLFALASSFFLASASSFLASASAFLASSSSSAPSSFLSSLPFFLLFGSSLIKSLAVACLPLAVPPAILALSWASCLSLSLASFGFSFLSFSASSLSFCCAFSPRCDACKPVVMVRPHLLCHPASRDNQRRSPPGRPRATASADERPATGQ